MLVIFTLDALCLHDPEKVKAFWNGIRLAVSLLFGRDLTQTAEDLTAFFREAETEFRPGDYQVTSRQITEFCLWRVLSRCGVFCDGERIRQLAEIFEMLYTEHFPFNSNAVEVLLRLKLIGCKLALMEDGTTTKADPRNAGLIKFFDQVVPLEMRHDFMYYMVHDAVCVTAPRGTVYTDLAVNGGTTTILVSSDDDLPDDCASAVVEPGELMKAYRYILSWKRMKEGED